MVCQGAQHRTPVHLAASHAGSAAGAALRDLLAAGGALECLDADGETPLLAALQGNRRDAVDILLAAGASCVGPCRAVGGVQGSLQGGLCLARLVAVLRLRKP